MALVQGKVPKVYSALARIHVRSLSSPPKVNNEIIKKSVFISQSNDIYTNLALEEWVYKNFNFNDHQVLLLCRNDPCVVIGKNQNPWVETNANNLSNIAQTGVQLARRQSSGSAIYQDQGNLNMTFFTPKKYFNSSYNLELVSRALFREYSMKVNISPRQELMIRNTKVSSSSSKLGKENAYQQCSILVNVNKVDLMDALFKLEPPIKSNAVTTPISKYMNLVEENYHVTVNGLVSSIGWEYMRTPALVMKDGGKKLANQQKGFQMINPTEKWFPGITEIRERLTKWEWNYGETPKFTINRSFPIPDRFRDKLEDLSSDLSITMTVEQGKIKGVTMFIPLGLSKTGFSGDAKVITSLKGRKFSEEALDSLEYYLRGSNSDYVDEKDKFVSDCVREVMTSV